MVFGPAVAKTYPGFGVSEAPQQELAAEIALEREHRHEWSLYSTFDDRRP